MENLETKHLKSQIELGINPCGEDSSNSDKCLGSSIFRTYTKIKRLGDDENKDIFISPEEEIVIEEKMDGANFRFMIKNGTIIFGSRTQELSPDKEHKFAKNFTRCISYIIDKIKGKDITTYEGMVFYGECMVSHSMQYDWTNIPPFLGFDINNESNQSYPKRYIPYPQNNEIFEDLGLDFVPVIKVCKASEIDKIDDSFVPISKYAILSGTEDTRKAEGVVFKKYTFKEGSKEQIDNQIFAKYVRDKFKELNAEVFGGKSVKYNGEDNTPDLVFKYCTNARIDKMIFKLIDKGKPLATTMMPDLIRGVLNDIYEECSLEILKSDWVIDFPKMRKLIPKRCIAVLNQVITNNALNKGDTNETS
jgi:hypothetical protein